MSSAKLFTRYELGVLKFLHDLKVGVLKILHDLGGGAKILHDYSMRILLYESINLIDI